MKASNQYTLKLTVTIKAQSERDAEIFLANRMNNWLIEDNDYIEGYGYPDGSLLYWNNCHKGEKR
jgi:hypothetical protein